MACDGRIIGMAIGLKAIVQFTVNMGRVAHHSPATVLILWLMNKGMHQTGRLYYP